MNEKELQRQLQTKVRRKLETLFAKYRVDFGGIDASLKWKPLVLVIGNYSSGKSTLINELVGKDIQRTGQAPTDDDFTIITKSESGGEAQVPGSTLVNDDTLPFEHFKHFGEKLISHICMKNVDSDALENLAIIDSPGMLDATSEKDRGYDYLQVLGEFAKMADLIVLMFDPHKAGTIRESYEAIRNTLPEKSGEHRTVFVMSRIDECDNLTDFTRSFGTLCWNMSQMTGRKDIPHIYLTYASSVVAPEKIAESWPQERTQLIEKIKGAASYQINHILEDIDRQVNEVNIVAEAVSSFLDNAKKRFWKYFNFTALTALLLLFFGDVIISSIFGMPENTLIESIRTGAISTAPLTTLALPVFLFVMTCVIGFLAYSKVSFPSLKKKTLTKPAALVSLETDYRKNLWHKMETKVEENLHHLKVKDLWAGYNRSMARIKSFLNNDLRNYYAKINNR